jgi:hypothetical protein
MARDNGYDYKGLGELIDLFLDARSFYKACGERGSRGEEKARLKYLEIKGALDRRHPSLADKFS